MKILPDLRRDIDVGSIVAAELASSNKLLPPRWGDRALLGSEGEVATWLTSLMRRELTVDVEEVVLARKLGGGGRPCAVLGLKERLIYRAAVSSIEVSVGTPDRSSLAFDEFQQAPLNVPGCAYILKADIAS